MFASSITENQVIAAIITVAFLIMSDFVTNIDEKFSMISLASFYQRFPAGIISLKEIIGLTSFAMVFICLTIIVMQRRKSVK